MTVPVGVSMFVTDRSIGVGELAIAAEDRAFDVLWLPEHTHVPIESRAYGSSDEPLDPTYARAIDPFVGLATAAALTKRLRIGTKVCQLAQRDPIVTAKAAATLDVVSGGRFIFGVGYSWNRPELANHGVAYEQRRSLVRERLFAMRRLWQDDIASFDGEHVRLTASWSWPKPVQRPGLPVLLAGHPGPRLFRDIVDLADGWLPMGLLHAGDAAVTKLRRDMSDAGRNPNALEIVAGVSPATVDQVGRLTELGATSVVVNLPTDTRDETLRTLDALAAILRPTGAG
jgi:probable F420-dependent oxidoreductase